MDASWPNKVKEAKVVYMVQYSLCSVSITKKNAYYFKENETTSLRKWAFAEKWDKIGFK